MDINELKEEIKLLERKAELLEQIKLQAIPVYPTPVYPIYPSIDPWWQVYPYRNTTVRTYAVPGGTITFPNVSISAHNGPATTDTTMIKEGDQFSYTN